MIGEATTSAWVQALLGPLADPVALVDESLVIAAANPVLHQLVGGDPRGRPVAGLLAPGQTDVLRRAVQRAGPTSSWVAASTLLQADGRRRPVQVHVGAVRAPGFRGAMVTLVPGSAETDAASRPDLAAELAEALRGDQVVLHYQPVVRLTDRAPVLVEALARWEHPTRGLLWPADFLATADTAELAGPLGRRVLREACHAAAGWARTVPGAQALQVAVNLSQRQLFEPGTATFVREALLVAACPPELLLLEVPESALLADPEVAAEALRSLKALGVGVAVDDLGTGSSSLSYLSRFPIDLVKVDRSLIAGVGSDTDQSAVVASLVALSRAVGVRCVAEGVETADQLAVLRLLGCELGQGYMFTRPMTRHAMDDWLARTLQVRPRARAAPAVSVAPETAARALALQDQGASLHTIAARLNAEGHRNAVGRRWHHTAVAQLIAAQRFPDLPL